MTRLGYYRAQGVISHRRIRPLGALLTYYLREDFAAAERWCRRSTDSTGRQVRQLDASSNAGLHRTPWDLRETAPAVRRQADAAVSKEARPLVVAEDGAH